MKIISLAFLALGLGACATPKDYTEFKKEKPKSILVLPPLNESTEIQGTYSFLSTITQPIAEQGYYVFPVAMVDRLLRDNGLPGPGEMHQASMKKIKEIINPDAVLYIVVNKYGTKFQVIDSNTTVEATGRLVSAKTGKILWEGTASANHSANAANQGGFLAHVLNAAVSQAINDSLDSSREIAVLTSNALIRTKNQGFIEGPYLVDSKLKK